MHGHSNIKYLNLRFENFLKICQEHSVSLKPDKNNAYLHIIIIPRLILLAIKNVSRCIENQKTHFMCDTVYILILLFVR